MLESGVRAYCSFPKVQYSPKPGRLFEIPRELPSTTVVSKLLKTKSSLGFMSPKKYQR